MFQFLQYTIHFINECDSFLHKLQRESSPRTESSVAPNCKAEEKPKTGRKKKENEKKPEEEANSVVNERLSARLVKSMPKVKCDAVLRTPTKGGSSAFNLRAMLVNEEQPEPDEKNLVSKRLREMMNTEERVKEVCSPRCKKVRPVLESDEEDSNSIIIIDSDENEDEYVKCAQFECIGSKELKFDDDFEMEIEEPSEKTVQIKMRKISVLLEKMDLEKIMRENGIRVSGEVFAALGEKSPPLKQLQENSSKQTKRLKNKSKTIQAKSNKENFTELDAITFVEQIKADNKTKQKSEFQNTGLIRLATSLTTSMDNSLSEALPLSPAQLLRKYSSTDCEMDKLFKGASVTVTECLECENLRKCPESFFDRSIPVETSHLSDNGDDSDWISRLLKNESFLNENSKYMCDRCASKQEARLYTLYTQMPKILILHLLSYGITSK